MALFNNRQIAKVKVIGVRTAEQTKVMATYNSTIYCVAILFTDGARALDECDYNKMMNLYLRYLDMS